MVLCVIKKAENSLFLLETTVKTPIKSIINTITEINNKKIVLTALIQVTRDLIAHGPEKPENQHGYSDQELDSHLKEPQPKVNELVFKIVNGKQCVVSPDPLGKRTGFACLPDQALVIEKELANAEIVCSADHIKANKPILLDNLNEAFNLIKASITIVYPEGLPEYDPTREILDGNFSFEGSSLSKEIYKNDETSIWWANKELMPEKTLFDYIGKNEKTKIIIKITRKGQGAPVREAPLNEQAQKEMMAYYYKKQEEQKKLLENADDDYLNSSWADRTKLKSHFNGLGGGVKFRVG
jgi:hypothetical protein